MIWVKNSFTKGCLHAEWGKQFGEELLRSARQSELIENYCLDARGLEKWKRYLRGKDYYARGTLRGVKVGHTED